MTGFLSGTAVLSARVTGVRKVEKCVFIIVPKETGVHELFKVQTYPLCCIYHSPRDPCGVPMESTCSPWSPCGVHL